MLVGLREVMLQHSADAAGLTWRPLCRLILSDSVWRERIAVERWWSLSCNWLQRLKVRFAEQHMQVHIYL